MEFPSRPPHPYLQVAAARTKGDLPGAVEYLRTYLDFFMNDRDAWDELAELYLEVGRGVSLPLTWLCLLASYKEDVSFAQRAHIAAVRRSVCSLPAAELLSEANRLTCGWRLVTRPRQMGLYRQAAFCIEELLTMAPGEPHLHIRYGEALLTMGGPANARTARAHFSKAVALTHGRSARALYGLVACGAALQVRTSVTRMQPIGTPCNTACSHSACGAAELLRQPALS